MLKNNCSSARPPSRVQTRRSIVGQTLPAHAQDSGSPDADALVQRIVATVGVTTAPADECQRVLVRDPAIEETATRIVGTTAAPRFTSAPACFDSTTGVLEIGRAACRERM